MIGIFLKYPEPGRVKTRLAADVGNEKAAEYYRRMIDRVLAAAKATPYEVVLLCDAFRPREDYEALFPGYAITMQSEGDLGKRLSNAFDSLLARHGRVAIVGSDCVTITPEHYRATHESDADLVLGPATDGGYYLIGLKRPAPRLFEGITWSTDRVLTQTMDRAGGLSTLLLPPLSDVDTLADLRRSGLE